METTICDFEPLEDYVRGFASGHINMLGIIGSAGIQKSTVVRQIMGDTARYIEGIATPFELHRELWRWLNKPFVIDDVDNLVSNRPMVSQLKCLCDTKAVKRVSWHTAASALDEEGIPREFDTTTRVIIIANEWKVVNKNIGALQDRGHIIHFKPSAQAVHARVAGWFKDADISVNGEWGSCLSLIRTFVCRGSNVSAQFRQTYHRPSCLMSKFVRSNKSIPCRLARNPACRSSGADSNCETIFLRIFHSRFI